MRQLGQLAAVGKALQIRGCGPAAGQLACGWPFVLTAAESGANDA